MKCPACGQADLVQDLRDIPYFYKGESTIIPNVEADWCRACSESFTGPAESKRVMLAMNLARQHVNARSGHLELIRAVRKQLKLTQKQAGELFGGGPQCIQSLRERRRGCAHCAGEAVPAVAEASRAGG